MGHDPSDGGEEEGEKTVSLYRQDSQGGPESNMSAIRGNGKWREEGGSAKFWGRFVPLADLAADFQAVGTQAAT